MRLNSFRPWGRLDWVLRKLPERDWWFLGCMGTEERSLTAWLTLRHGFRLAGYRMLDVQDRPSAKFSELGTRRREEMRTKYAEAGGELERIEEHQLEEREEQIVDCIRRFLSGCGADVVFDFSAFPKRFFFPIVKMLLRGPELSNILGVYTVPVEHSTEKLAENLTTWRPLPMFRPPDPEPDDKVMVVGLGFDPLGLPDLLGQDFLDTDVNLFFPVSGGPPGFRRNWEFVRKIEIGLGKISYNRIPVSAYDVSDIFEHLKKVTDNGSRYAILAPYGPKPMSLAMCVFATLNPNKACAFYTQPREYNPDYSIGVKTDGTAPLTYAYCLKLAGRVLYAI
jgi:hypothetical protein